MTANLLGAFQSIASSCGQPQKSAQQLFDLLPSALQNCRVLFLGDDRTWYYFFAANYDRLPNDMVGCGTDQTVPVVRLYCGLRTFKSRFSDNIVRTFVGKLANPDKHLETLAELAPLLRIPDSVEVEYEVPGSGTDGKKIDYTFKVNAHAPILLDVKYRSRGKIDHFKEIIPHLSAGVVGVQDLELTPPDPQNLFRDTVDKFISRSPAECLQGVWIHPDLKYEKRTLENCFHGLDSGRLHFAILAYWNEKAYVLAKNQATRERIASFFNLIHSNDFVVE